MHERYCCYKWSCNNNNVNRIRDADVYSKDTLNWIDQLSYVNKQETSLQTLSVCTINITEDSPNLNWIKYGSSVY